MMKTTIKYFSVASLLSFTMFSCSKTLDINKNPNSPTESTPQLVFPQALVSTARLVPNYNTYGSQIAGYFANGGGVSGWGAIISYNYTNANFATLWGNTYNTLEDFQYVLNATRGDATTSDFYNASNIFKAFNFINLVDTYNDVPYSQAFKGLENLTPSYDKAQDIYKDLGSILDSSIAYFKASTASSRSFTATDFLFKGDPVKWAKFANTLKLKMLIRAKDKVQFAKTTLDDVGFITDDIIINPGFAKLDGKQNPMWNEWAYNYAGTAVGAASQYAVTPFIRGYYDGGKISDPGRTTLVFRTGNTTAVNQLGYQGSDAGRGASPSSWFRGTNATTYEGRGILKGSAAGQPIILAAESYFLQAEAALTGLASGNVTTLFESGIKESFEYLNKNETDVLPAAVDTATAYLNRYKTLNVNNRLVNIALATSDAQRLEAIITQKYIAMNMLFGHEAWNEYRRTGYPVSGQPTAANRLTSFASLVSEATAADKLPARIMYPNTEYNYNSNNIPEIDKYTSKIFWAR